MKFTELPNVDITNTLRENNVSYLKETRSLERNTIIILITATYFNLFLSFLVTQYVCYDQSAKFYSLILIFSTLCIIHDLIFQRKLSRRRLPITFVYFVSHASVQALRLITFTQRFRTTRRLISIQLL